MLAEEYMAVEELADVLWSVSICPLRIGRSPEPLLKIVDQHDGTTIRNPRRVLPMSLD
jgi:hypothetical protein